MKVLSTAYEVRPNTDGSWSVWQTRVVKSHGPVFVEDNELVRKKTYGAASRLARKFHKYGVETVTTYRPNEPPRGKT